MSVSYSSTNIDRYCHPLYLRQQATSLDYSILIGLKWVCFFCIYIFKLVFQQFAVTRFTLFEKGNVVITAAINSVSHRKK